MHSVIWIGKVVFLLTLILQKIGEISGFGGKIQGTAHIPLSYFAKF